MPNVCRALLAVVVALVVLPWGVGAVRHGYGPYDAHAAFWRRADRWTTFSDEFTEVRFASVSPGAARDDVHALLGAPLAHPPWLASDASTEFYAWQSRHARAGHVRVVRYDDAGRVVRTEARLYDD